MVKYDLFLYISTSKFTDVRLHEEYTCSKIACSTEAGMLHNNRSVDGPPAFQTRWDTAEVPTGRFSQRR